MAQVKMKDLSEKEKLLDQEVLRIEKAEEKIEREEKKILEAERTILGSVKRKAFKALALGPGLTIREFHLLRQTFVRRVARHKLVFGLLVTFAVVLIWRGFWHTVDELPVLSYSLVSLLVGIILIWLISKYTSLH